MKVYIEVLYDNGVSEKFEIKQYESSTDDELHEYVEQITEEIYKGIKENEGISFKLETPEGEKVIINLLKAASVKMTVI